MEKEFIPYEQALELKELGFDEECLFAYYGKSDLSNFKESDYELCGDRHNSSLKDGRVSAPLYQQVFRWFREKKLIDLIVSSYQSRDDGDTYYYYQITNNYGIEEIRHFKEGFFTYEEAELAGLQKMIEIIEKK